MINKEFVDETNKLIVLFKDRAIKAHNGNIIFAKVKMERVSKGGIILDQSHVNREDNKMGFGRVIALPENFGHEGDPKISEGDYFLYSHESRYKPYTSAVREILGYEVADDFLYSVQDNEPIVSIDSAKLN